MHLDYNALLWPLAFLLVALLLIRQLRADLNPIFRVIVGGVAQNAATNALPYAMAMMYAAAASLQALGDEARTLGWVYVAALCKVLQPGVVTLIAYVAKPPAVFVAEPANKQPPANPAP